MTRERNEVVTLSKWLFMDAVKMLGADAQPIHNEFVIFDVVTAKVMIINCNKRNKCPSKQTPTLP